MTDHWKEAFAITTGLIRKFKDSVEANGGQSFRLGDALKRGASPP